MKAPGCALLLLLLLQCGSSLPVTQSHLEHEDVKVIKCIVAILADVLSTPQSRPVSQQCLETLRTDDRLVTVLRHRNFLQELQDIAGEGANQRPEMGTEERPDVQDPADQSMLVAVRTPGETLQERGTEEEEEEEEENDIITHPKKGEGVVIKKAESSEEEDEGENKAPGAPERKHVEKEKKQVEELEQKVEKKEESVEKKAADVGEQKPWSRRNEQDQRRARAQQEASPHHSEEVWPSPEEEELQMMAERNPEEHRDPEEGSATKKTEEGEMESLAVIEDELENMAQKLHELRRG